LDKSSTQQRDASVYNYVFVLEEKLKGLENEREVSKVRIARLQAELSKVKEEIRRLSSPPLIVGNVVDIIDSKAVVKNSNGMDFMVEIENSAREDVFVGARVAMNQRSLSIMRALPDSRDRRVNAMEIIEKPKASLADVGGLDDAVRELEETVILPLTQNERFENLGIEAPNGILLYGVPGTGKTLIAKAIANKTNSTFISLSGTELVRKFIGEGARLVRDMFKLGEEKKPAIIFIDEIDAIGAHRHDTVSGDREVQRTLMQLLSEMDGFKEKKQIKIIAATNRIDIIDPALLRAGRFDRIIEVPVPDEKAREEIFKIHTKKMSLEKRINLKKIAIDAEGLTGASIKAVCTEAGIFALRENQKKVSMNNFIDAIAKVRGKNISENNREQQRMLA
jgi:proteasome regulatory subunit